MKLTDRHITVDGKRASEMALGGYTAVVFDSADVALRLIELLHDDLEPDLKIEIMLRLLFPNPQEVVDECGMDVGKVMFEAVWRVAGIDMDGSHKGETSEEEIIDFEKDAEIISISIWQAYGRRIDEVIEQITFDEFCSMLAMAPSEVPIAQALYYRKAEEPQPTKYNAKQIEEFRKRKAFWSLHKQDGVAANNDALDSAFAALKGLANGK